MHAVPSVIAAAELRRQDLVTQGIREQWVEDALVAVMRTRHLDVTSAHVSSVPSLSAAVGFVRSRLTKLAAMVFALSSN